MRPSTRFWYAPDKPVDEPADSWIRRTASVYHVSPTQLLHHLQDGGGEEEASDESRLVQAAIASTRATFSDTPPGPYCPMCFSRDLHVGRLPYFRRQWQQSWSTHCSVDGLPLFLWPYHDSSGQIAYPQWVAEAHFARKARVRKDQEDAKTRMQLRCARQLRTQIGAGATEALPWLQQLDQEKVLLDPRRAPTRALMGLAPDAVRRVVSDLATLLGHNFRRGDRCQAAHLAKFLGPRWLYAASFPSGRPLDRHTTRCLSSFVDPAQRRTLITLAIRLLTSFASDPEFTRDAMLVDAGQTILTRELKNCSEAAVQWVQARSRYWPEFISVGVRNAMRCEPGRWAVPR